MEKKDEKEMEEKNKKQDFDKNKNELVKCDIDSNDDFDDIEMINYKMPNISE